MATEVKQPWVQALLDWYYANGRELPCAVWAIRITFGCPK